MKITPKFGRCICLQIMTLIMFYRLIVATLPYGVASIDCKKEIHVM